MKCMTVKEIEKLFKEKTNKKLCQRWNFFVHFKENYEINKKEIKKFFYNTKEV